MKPYEKPHTIRLGSARELTHANYIGIYPDGIDNNQRWRPWFPVADEQGGSRRERPTAER